MNKQHIFHFTAPDMIRLDIGLEIRHGGVMRVCAIEDKIVVVVVVSYHSVSRNPVRFKALKGI